MKQCLLLMIALTLAGCALPRYEQTWDSYKKTTYSASVQSQICQSEASAASSEMRAKLAAHYNKELESCRNRAMVASSQRQSTNPYSGVSTTMIRNNDLQTCQSSRTLANVNIGNMASSHAQKAFEQCMVSAGFLSRRVCVANCQR